ncbi:MAG: hypothetical protein JNM36_13560 [Chitinophagales bacterium]|nr:hypothetical protein [Chitinophagales bacterium]
MAKRVRDAEGGVSQCGEQRSTEAKRSPQQPDPQGNAQKNQCVITGLFKQNGTVVIFVMFYHKETL